MDAENPVVHFEILGPDGPALTAVYRKLFGRRLHDGQLPGWSTYALLRAGSGGVGDAVGCADAATEPTVLVYVEVEGPQAYLTWAEEWGAPVLVPAP